MKITKRLRLNIWISLGMIVLMALSLVWSFREVYRADRNTLLADDMRNAVFERISLRDDYLLHRQEQAITGWYTKSETLRALLEQARERFTSIEDRTLLQNAQKDFDATVSAFSEMAEKYKREGLISKRGLVANESESRLIALVLSKAYVLNGNIVRLCESAKTVATTARNRATILVIFFVVGGVSMIIGNSVMMSTILMKRVAVLSKGAEIIGSGNLDHHIDVQGDDEFSYLAQVSNKMVDKLKLSYVSADDLRQEVAERCNAEENVIKLSLHQQSLITAIPDIIMEVDTNKHYIWANGPGIDFFGEDVIGKEAAFYFVRVQNTNNIVQSIFDGNEDIIYLESWQRRKDGKERLLGWWCRVLKDKQGNVTGVLSSARDITEQKLAEKIIKKLNEELEERVTLRTSELFSKTAELERVNKLFVNRELRMREVKAQIVELERKNA